MFDVVIHGAHYALVGSNVYMDIESVALPPNVDPASVEIKWYRDNIFMKQFSWEEPFKFELWDVGYPAGGDYHCVVSVKDTNIFAKSNTIHLEIGTVPRDITIHISMPSSISVIKNGLLNLTAICTTTPDFAHRECKWYKDNVQVSSEELLSVIMSDASKYGEYVLKVRAFAHGGFNESNLEAKLMVTVRDTDPGPDACPVIHIHDLNPGRDRGFIWIGWWVHDEILKAKAEGFDWMADPTNERFKYKCELANLVDGFTRWPDLEIQESRHGYILTKKDLI